jgi:O-antigen ligase
VNITANGILWFATLMFLTTSASGLGPYTTEFGPYWFALLLCNALLILLLQPRELLCLLKRPGVALGAAFFGGLLMASSVSPVARELNLGIPLLTNLICFFVAAWAADRYAGRPCLSYALAPALAIVVGANLFELLVAPNTWSLSPGRAAGYFVNPNTSGAVIGMLVCQIAIGLPRWRVLFSFLLLSGGLVAVVATFSRGSFVVFGVMAACMQVLIVREQKAKPWAVLLPLMAIVITLLLLTHWLGGQTLTDDALLRLDSMLTGDFDDSSSLAREDAFADFLDRFLDHPLLGAGMFGTLYAVDGMGPHNAFLAAAADFGIFGLAIYVSVIVSLLRGAARLSWRGPHAMHLLVIAIWTTLASLFSHNVFYSPEGAVFIGLGLGALPSKANERSDRVGRVGWGNA